MSPQDGTQDVPPEYLSMIQAYHQNTQSQQQWEMQPRHAQVPPPGVSLPPTQMAPSPQTQRPQARTLPQSPARLQARPNTQMQIPFQPQPRSPQPQQQPPQPQQQTPQQPRMQIITAPPPQPSPQPSYEDAALQRIRALVTGNVVVAQLNQILRALGLPLSGVKQRKQELLMKKAELNKANGNREELMYMLQICEQYIAAGSATASRRRRRPATDQPLTYTAQVNQISDSPFAPPPQPQPQPGAPGVGAVGPQPGVPLRLPPIYLNARSSAAHMARARAQAAHAAQMRAAQAGRSPQPAPTGTLTAAVSEARRMGLKFWESPFYHLMEAVSAPVFMLAPHMSRVVSRSFQFVFPEQSQSDDGPTVVLVAQLLNGEGCEDQRDKKGGMPMHFPFYLDIELDGRKVKVNTRGVRGCTGSAKPVDLKKFLLENAGDRRLPSLKNTHTLKVNASIVDTGEVTSTKSFVFALQLARFVSTSQLLEEIKARPHIAASETKKMVAALADEDVVADDTVYSLKDTVTMTRIRTPVRSRACTHIDCFDAESFLLLQAQAETWKCPVCNHHMEWDSLAVDEFFTEVLRLAGPTITSVTIKADGSWFICAESDDDDDTSSDDDVPPPKRNRTEHTEVVEILSDDDEDSGNTNNTNNSTAANSTNANTATGPYPVRGNFPTNTRAPSSSSQHPPSQPSQQSPPPMRLLPRPRTLTISDSSESDVIDLTSD